MASGAEPAPRRYATVLMMQTLSIVVCSLVGAICGAILLGDFTSLPWTIVGAVLGLVVGWLLGKFIPWYDWFV